MILPIKFVSHVFCILTKFRDFLKPETVMETYEIHVGNFDINNNLVIEVCFVLEPCNFSILLLITL